MCEINYQMVEDSCGYLVLTGFEDTQRVRYNPETMSFYFAWGDNQGWEDIELQDFWYDSSEELAEFYEKLAELVRATSARVSVR